MFGNMKPIDQLDALSRLHDTAYARYSDYGHRAAADILYSREADKLVGAFPQLASYAVNYGNQTLRAASGLAKGFFSAGPLGALYGAVRNMLDLMDLTTNQDAYIKDILSLYESDPNPSLQQIETLLSTQPVYNPLVGTNPPVYTGSSGLVECPKPVYTATGYATSSLDAAEHIGSNVPVVYDPVFLSTYGEAFGRRKGNKWRKRRSL